MLMDMAAAEDGPSSDLLTHPDEEGDSVMARLHGSEETPVFHNEGPAPLPAAAKAEGQAAHELENAACAPAAKRPAEEVQEEAELVLSGRRKEEAPTLP